MNIYLIPILSSDRKFKYTFGKDKITVEYKGKKDVFDFSIFPDGEMKLMDESGNELIETVLEENPIASAKREGGVLYLELVNFLSPDSPGELRFPEWFEPKDGDVING